MKQLPYLRVRFDAALRPHELPYFRAAVIERTERREALLHNHRDDTRVIYRYPLVQYKRLDRRAGIVCLGAGTDAIHALFRASELDLQIGRRRNVFRVEDMQLTQFRLQLTPGPRPYELRHYLPFNSERIKRWQQLYGQRAAQLDLLEATLRGNLLAFAKGVGWWIDGTVRVRIDRVRRVRHLAYKGQSMLGFDLSFRTNLHLAPHIGLGKGVSLGFGQLYPTPAPVRSFV